MLIIFQPQGAFVGFKTLQMWRPYKRSTLICSQIGPTLGKAKQMQPGLRACCKAEAVHSADTPSQLFVIIACWLKGAFVLCWKASMWVFWLVILRQAVRLQCPQVPQRLAAKGSLLKSMLVLPLQLVNQFELIIKIVYGTPSHKSPGCIQRYKDTLILSHTRTHMHTHMCTYTTNTCISDYWWWVGRMRRKKTTDQYAEEKRWVFSFDLRDESEDKCLPENL